MSEDREDYEDDATEARWGLKALAARAVEVARTARSATSSAAAKATAAAKAAASRAPEPSEADADTPDERDEQIARLEHDIGAERARTAELESAVKALEFKLGILEQSYGKQLADARAEGDAAKRELAEVKAQLAETIRELKDVTAHRDRLRDMLSFDGRRIPPELRDRQPGDEDTIARILNAVPDPGEKASDPSAADDEPETGDLLSPDLVFDANDDREDDDETRAARG